MLSCTEITRVFSELEFPFSLGSDNHSGVHPKILNAIQMANRGHAHAYGMDELCQLSEKEFKRVFGPDVQVEYVFTGTSANVLALAPYLKSYNSVFCSDLAHLNVDECGAPEKFWGAKLIGIPSQNGKISPEQIEPFLDRGGDQHHSQPAAVSLTQPTELGTCYTLEELSKWREFTRHKNLMLHIDGARLSNAAAYLKCDLKSLTSGIGADVVSFGGTKNGLLGAEAVLIFNPALKKDFKFYRKQAMQLSSKTRFLAAQFYSYLENDLWLDIARHTTLLAQELSLELNKFPEITQPFPCESNGVFATFPQTWVKALREKFFFYIWDSDIQLCRLMISWDWTRELNQSFLNHLKKVQKCFPIK